MLEQKLGRGIEPWTPTRIRRISTWLPFLRQLSDRRITKIDEPVNNNGPRRTREMQQKGEKTTHELTTKSWAWGTQQLIDSSVPNWASHGQQSTEEGLSVGDECVPTLFILALETFFSGMRFGTLCLHRSPPFRQPRTQRVLERRERNARTSRTNNQSHRVAIGLKHKGLSWCLFYVWTSLSDSHRYNLSSPKRGKKTLMKLNRFPDWSSQWWHDTVHGEHFQGRWRNDFVFGGKHWRNQIITTTKKT